MRARSLRALAGRAARIMCCPLDPSNLMHTALCRVNPDPEPKRDRRNLRHPGSGVTATTHSASAQDIGGHSQPHQNAAIMRVHRRKRRTPQRRFVENIAIRAATLDQAPSTCRTASQRARALRSRWVHLSVVQPEQQLQHRNGPHAHRLVRVGRSDVPNIGLTLNPPAALPTPQEPSCMMYSTVRYMCSRVAVGVVAAWIVSATPIVAAPAIAVENPACSGSRQELTRCLLRVNPA